MGKVATQVLLTDFTGTTFGESFEPCSLKRAFQAHGTTTAGVGAVDVIIEVSLDNSHFITMGTISLVLGTVATTDGFTSDAPWRWIRGRVSSISGTGAKVTAIMGNEYGR